MENKDIIQEVIKEMNDIDKELNSQKEDKNQSFAYDEYYDNLPRVLKKNKDIVIAALSLDNRFVSTRNLDPSFINDKDVAKAVLLRDWSSTTFFKDIIDEEFALELAKEGVWLGETYEGVLSVLNAKNPDVFKNDNYVRKLLEYPVTDRVLHVASDEIKNDKNLIVNALKTQKYIDHVFEDMIGDDLKKDEEVQMIFAQRMMNDGTHNRRSGLSADSFLEVYSEDDKYSTLSDMDKEFIKGVIDTDGFVDSAISYYDNRHNASEYRENIKASAQYLINRLNEDLEKTSERTQGTSR